MSKYKSLYALTLVMASSSFGSALWQALFSIYLEEKGISYVGIGLSSSIIFMLPSILALPAGIISDTYDKRKLITLSLLANSIVVFFLPIIKNIYILMIITLIYGSLSAIFSQSALSLVAHTSTTSFRATAYSLYYFAGQVLGTIGTFLSGPFIERYGYNILYVLASISYMISASLAIFLLNDTSHMFGKIPDLHRSLHKLRETLRVSKRLRLLITAVALHDCASFMAVPFVALFAKNVLNLSKSTVSLLLGVRSTSMMLMQVLSGRLADIFGGAQLLALHIILMSFLNALYGLSKTFTEALILMILLGIVFSLDMPARRALLSILAPKDLIASVNGIADTITGIFAIISSTLSGYLWQVGYVREIFILAGLCNALAIPFIVALARSNNENQNSSSAPL